MLINEPEIVTELKMIPLGGAKAWFYLASEIKISRIKENLFKVKIETIHHVENNELSPQLKCKILENDKIRVYPIFNLTGFIRWAGLGLALTVLLLPFDTISWNILNYFVIYFGFLIVFQFFISPIAFPIDFWKLKKGIRKKNRK